MKVNGRKVGHIISGPQALRGYFSLSELEAQINSLVREDNERSAPRASSDKYVADAKKNYEAALKNTMISLRISQTRSRRHNSQSSVMI